MCQVVALTDLNVVTNMLMSTRMQTRVVINALPRRWAGKAATTAPSPQSAIARRTQVSISRDSQAAPAGCHIAHIRDARTRCSARSHDDATSPPWAPLLSRPPPKQCPRRAALCACDSHPPPLATSTLVAPAPPSSTISTHSRLAAPWFCGAPLRVPGLGSILSTRAYLVHSIEDTDAARSTKESEEAVLRDLTWLGIKWDEGTYTCLEKGGYTPKICCRYNNTYIYNICNNTYNTSTPQVRMLVGPMAPTGNLSARRCTRSMWTSWSVRAGPTHAFAQTRSLNSALACHAVFVWMEHTACIRMKAEATEKKLPPIYRCVRWMGGSVVDGWQALTVGGPRSQIHLVLA